MLLIQALGLLGALVAVIMLAIGRALFLPSVYTWGILVGLAALIAITFPENCRRQERAP
jgi:hypothetical protein